eukprot:3110808-Pleurochrysis_carterae.AAC.1
MGTSAVSKWESAAERRRGLNARLQSCLIALAPPRRCQGAHHHHRCRRCRHFRSARLTAAGRLRRNCVRWKRAARRTGMR